jgi:hypothetical protein
MTKLKKSGLIGIALMTVGLFGSRAEAQQNYFGFTAMPSQVAALAASMAGQVPPGCAPAAGGCVEYYGCTVTPCPYTPPPNCVYIPSGGTANLCTVLCDQAPTNPPVTLTVYKNYFVPIYVANNGVPNVVPVNLQIKWREIHYLANAQGQPIDQNGNVLQNPASVVPPPGTPISGSTAAPGAAPAAPSPQHGANATPPPTVPVASATPNAQPAAPPMLPLASQPQAPAPSMATNVQVNTPAKQWVWLQNEGAYGYGYQRADGLWEIDQGSRRTTPPDASQPPSGPVTTASAN